MDFDKQGVAARLFFVDSAGALCVLFMAFKMVGAAPVLQLSSASTRDMPLVCCARLWLEAVPREGWTASTVRRGRRLGSDDGGVATTRRGQYSVRYTVLRSDATGGRKSDAAQPRRALRLYSPIAIAFYLPVGRRSPIAPAPPATACPRADLARPRADVKLSVLLQRGAVHRALELIVGDAGVPPAAARGGR
eukprot:5030856-Pleurochrysis_carterae.AAC.4